MLFFLNLIQDIQKLNLKYYYFKFINQVFNTLKIIIILLPNYIN